MRWLTVAPLVAFVLLGVVIGAAIVRRGTPAPAGTLVGEAMPAFDLPGLVEGGDRFTNADIAGRAVVINVWASWCPPCRAEHPLLVSLAERGAVIYGVVWKDSPRAASEYLAELGDPYVAVGLDREGRLGDRLGVTGAPETLIVGPDGVVAWHWKGPIDESIIATRLVPALAAASSP